MRNLARILLAVALLLPSGLAGATEVRMPPPLERTVRLRVWGGGLNDAVRSIGEQTGLKIVYYQRDFPDLGTNNLYLVSGPVPVRAALECLARRYSFRYCLSEKGQIELSRSYDWAAAAPVLRFTRLGDAASADGDLEAVRALLGEFVKPLSLLPDKYSVTLEKSPTRDNPHSIRCVIALPPVMASYLERAIACLAGSAGDGVGAPRPDAGTFAAASNETPSWESILGRPVDLARSGDLPAVLEEIASQARVAILLPAPPSALPSPVAVSGGNSTLGRITGELASRYHLGRRLVLASGAILFEPGSGTDLETDARNREFFWTGLAVSGFSAQSAADRLGGGEALVRRIRRQVFPALWSDPLCGLAYSRENGRLAVVAPWNVMQAIDSALREWAR